MKAVDSFTSDKIGFIPNPEQLSWYDEKGLSEVFAKIEPWNTALAEMGMADYAKGLREIDEDVVHEIGSLS